MLSYILPVYGAEFFIAKCLDSIYSQGIPESEFEVICVDDCSPDNSRGIIKAYQIKHPNLILVEHDINKKAGGARNTGLYKARGKYVWFIDPDDYIPEGAAITIINNCTANNLDVLCFNHLIKKNNIEQADCVFSENSQIENGISFLVNRFGKGIVFNLGYP